MVEIQSPSLQEQILSTLTQCILKMSDQLLKTFNPEEKTSLTLFKQFCSAINARRQWIKSWFVKSDAPVEKKEKSQSVFEKPARKETSNLNWLERKLSESNTNNPIKPEHLKSGLVCR